MSSLTVTAAKKTANRGRALGLVWIATATLFGLWLPHGPASAARPVENFSATVKENSGGDWAVVPTKLEGASLRVYRLGDGCQPNRGYVICHGLEGTVAGDRFEQLAQKLVDTCPEAWVVQVDWSPLSKGKCLGVTSPWKVARKIPFVAEACHEAIVQLGLESVQWTFIGESFGNNVNARVSELLDGQACMIAFNPASEMGGGGRLDLRECCSVSFALQTDSTYDSWKSMAHHDVFLMAAEGSNDLEKHTYGVQWLTEQLSSASQSVFETLKQLPPTDPEYFTASVDASGRLVQDLRPRLATAKGGGNESNPGSSTIADSSDSNRLPYPLAQGGSLQSRESAR